MNQIDYENLGSGMKESLRIKNEALPRQKLLKL